MKKHYISKKAIQHASQGTFIRKGKGWKMKSGGHGEENISLLNRRKMPHKIETEYSNGVRLGQIENHKNRRNCRHNGHAWFPTAWDRADIKKAGQHIVSLKRNRILMDGALHSGRYKGVSVGIIARNKKIQTIFPCFDVNRHARKKAHKLHRRDK